MKLFKLADVLEFRSEARERSTALARAAALKAANEAARKALVEVAPIRDLDDLVPVLSERVQRAKAEYEAALQELVDVLAAREARRHE